MVGIAADNAWAVGGPAFFEQGFIEHWDGAAWSTFPDPVIGFLADVAAVPVGSGPMNEVGVAAGAYEGSSR